jgi:putative methionine-R-sulfoxide reductase with GAF domain
MHLEFFSFASQNTIHKKNRYSQSCFGSKRSYSLHTRSSSSFKTNNEEIKAIETFLSSSSSSCSPVCDLKNLSKANEGQLRKPKKFQWLGIYMVVLISLVVTIFLGKINVIILTSMFVCCFSRLLERVGMLSNIKSKAQKNRQRGL